MIENREKIQRKVVRTTSPSQRGQRGVESCTPQHAKEYCRPNAQGGPPPGYGGPPPGYGGPPPGYGAPPPGYGEPPLGYGGQ